MAPAVSGHGAFFLLSLCVTAWSAVAFVLAPSFLLAAANRSSARVKRAYSALCHFV